jgi:hypothetical protein
MYPRVVSMSCKINSGSNIVVAGLFGALFLASTAQADIVIPMNSIILETHMYFSDRAKKAFRASNVTPQPVGTSSGSFEDHIILPASKLAIGPGAKSKGIATYAWGDGCGIKLNRQMDDGSAAWVVMANIAIDYKANQVIADFTIPGVPTAKKVPLYDFKLDTPLAIKYKFPISITGKEVMYNMYLTEKAKDFQMAGLQYEDFVRTAVLDKTDFGQGVNVLDFRFRPRPLSTKPYVVN